MKRKERPPKKEQGAPAYMQQYAALMTILLAFFILMLSMGQEKAPEFKIGVGMIRNLIGLTGGSGVMEFWRSMRQPGLPPRVEDKEDTEDAKLIGYEEGAVDRFSLDMDGLNRINFKDARKTLRLRSSIRFEPGRIRVSRDTQFALDQAVAMLYTLQHYRIVVGVLVHTGAPEADRLLAAQRAAWLTRHIAERAHIPDNRIRSLGMVRNLLDPETDEPVEVIFLLRTTRTT